MADVTPTLRAWPGPNRVADSPAGIRIYDPPALGRWKGLEFLAVSWEPSGGRTIAKIEPPYIPGQLVHDLGRKAWTVTMRILWVGDDWRQRMENFCWVLDLQSSSGTLELPDAGTVLTAHVETWSAPRTAEADSCEMTVTWAEDSQVDFNMMSYTGSATATAVGAVPADASAAAAAVANFRDVSNDPDATPEEISRAYAAADRELTDVELAQDTDTVAGCDAEEGCQNSRGLMVQSLADPSVLGGSAG